MRLRLQRDSLRRNRSSRFAAISYMLAAVLAASGCGYHVVGRVNALPEGVHTIAIPAFDNRTTQYRIEQILTQDVVHEFMTRTKYRVVPEADVAHLVMQGEVNNMAMYDVVFTPTT